MPWRSSSLPQWHGRDPPEIQTPSLLQQRISLLGLHLGVPSRRDVGQDITCGDLLSELLAHSYGESEMAPIVPSEDDHSRPSQIHELDACLLRTPWCGPVIVSMVILQTTPPSGPPRASALRVHRGPDTRPSETPDERIHPARSRAASSWPACCGGLRGSACSNMT